MAIRDEEIFQIYSALEKICMEINDLFLAIDELMRKRGYNPFSQLRWEIHNKSLTGGDDWLPYFSQRMYHKNNDNSRAIGLNLIMKDDDCNNRIPFITSGFIKFNKDINDGSDAFYGAGWNKDNDLLKLKNEVFSITRSKKENVEILSYFIKLTAVNTISSAERLIVTPLDTINNSIPNDWTDTKALEKVLQPITETIKKDTLSLAQIRGDAPLT